MNLLCPSLWMLCLPSQRLLDHQAVGAVELTNALLACAVLPPTNQTAQVAKWRVPHDDPGLVLTQRKETMPRTSAH